MKWPNYLDARVTTPVLKSHFHTLEQLLLLPEQPSQKETHLPWQRCNSCQQLLPLSLSGAEGHWGREHLHSLSQGCWALPTARNSRMQEGQSSKGLSGPGKGWAQLVADAAQEGRQVQGCLLTVTPHQGGGWGQHCQGNLASGVVDVLQKGWLSLPCSLLMVSDSQGVPGSAAPGELPVAAGGEEAATTLPDAPKATCHCHPVTHHPVCVPSQPPGPLGQTDIFCKP